LAFGLLCGLQIRIAWPKHAEILHAVQAGSHRIVELWVKNVSDARAV
jgi:hypothetical protein